MDTWTNPIALPAYPPGRFVDDRSNWGWRDRSFRPYRELADPSVLYEQGRWYLYASGRMAWVSDDGAEWRFVPVHPEDIGYAPTVVGFRGRYFLTACRAPLYRSESPLGPFRPIGTMTLPDGSPLPAWDDPMLFADGDRLFAYWGLGEPGIFGAELDASQPWRLVTEPKLLVPHDRAAWWETPGDYNEQDGRCFIEGGWMLHSAGRYYLTWAAPGTEFTTYAMGAAVGTTPLGPFTRQARNPILRTTCGLVVAPGHGCIVAGPGGALWAFYTCLVGVRHHFERRIGMDPAAIDSDGELVVLGAGELPRAAPARCRTLHHACETPWVNVTRRRPAREAPPEAVPGEIEPDAMTARADCGAPWHAVDGSMRTWWEPPTWPERHGQCALFVQLDAPVRARAARIVWYEYERLSDSPIGFRLDGRAASAEEGWITLAEGREAEFMLIDYREIDARERINLVRLTVYAAERQLGVMDLSIFAEPAPLPWRSAGAGEAFERIPDRPRAE